MTKSAYDDGRQPTSSLGPARFPILLTQSKQKRSSRQQNSSGKRRNVHRHSWAVWGSGWLGSFSWHGSWHAPLPAGAAFSPTGTLMGAAVGTADDSSPGATVSSFGGGQHCAWATAAASGHFSAEIRYPNSASCRPEQVRESPKPSRRRYSHTSRNKSH